MHLPQSQNEGAGTESWSGAHKTFRCIIEQVGRAAGQGMLPGRRQMPNEFMAAPAHMSLETYLLCCLSLSAGVGVAATAIVIHVKLYSALNIFMALASLFYCRSVLISRVRFMNISKIYSAHGKTGTRTSRLVEYTRIFA